MASSAVMSAAVPAWHCLPAVRKDSAERAPTRAGKISAVEDASALVERCRSGDKAAFRELFLAHKQDVSRLVFRMTGARADLEDLVQEVFLQVHRSIRDFRGDARFSTWLYRLTVNVVLMHRRSAKSRPQLVAELAAAPPPDVRLLPDEQVARSRRIAAFYRVMENLSEKKRTVFVLHEIEGMTPADISKVVGAPILTVRTRLFYARKELLTMLREEPSLSGVVSQLTEELVPASVRGESTWRAEIRAQKKRSPGSWTTYVECRRRSSGTTSTRRSSPAWRGNPRRSARDRRARRGSSR
jgi:RNA polymerase sigma-70 factor (ECF subfamily)